MRRVAAIAGLALLLAGCSSVNVTPAASPAVTCAGPETISVAIDASGTQSILPIVLTCDHAIAAAKAALTPALGTVTSLDFGYGRYCPPGWHCGPFPIGGDDLGFVIVAFSNSPSVVVSLVRGSGTTVVVTKIDKLADLDPRNSP